ncbi:MAG: transposase [Thiobacillaceae bacterium]|jgi:transposase
MKRVTYTAEFKAEAVKQITERGHGVVEAAKRLGISDKSLYAWIKQAGLKGQSVTSGEVAALRGDCALGTRAA